MFCAAAADGRDADRVRRRRPDARLRLRRRRRRRVLRRGRTASPGSATSRQGARRRCSTSRRRSGCGRASLPRARARSAAPASTRGSRPNCWAGERARRCTTGSRRRSPAWLRRMAELEALEHRHEPSARARAQNAAGSSSYSATNTALPAATNGRSRSHSSYWKHCSLSAQSKSGSSAATWSRSFLSPIESPRAWAAAARKRLKRSWSPAVSGKPLLVGVAVDVVGLDAVEALGRHRSSRALHDRPEHVEAADVEPALVRPAVERLAERPPPGTRPRPDGPARTSRR